MFCPPSIREDILRWLVLLYLGEPGGRTSYGNIRNVFFSNAGAPLAEDILKQAGNIIADNLKAMAKERRITALLEDQHIARRYQTLLDLVETE
jgi:hypothetical protein